RGRVYTGADFRKRREYEDKIWAEFRATRLTSEQAYEKLQEFHGPEGIDKFQDAERKRLSELKYQADQATKAAGQARAATNAATAQANAAAQAAEQAEKEAAKARTAYEECLKQIPPECPRSGGPTTGAVVPTGGAQTPPDGGGRNPGGVTNATENGKGPCKDCEELLHALQDK